MINTFHTSYNPPPVPPRTGYSRPPPPGNTPLVKFLSAVVMLLMMLTFGGFLYLFHRLNEVLPVSVKAAAVIAPAPPFNGPAAHLVLLNGQTAKYKSSSTKQLVWNKDQSLLQDVQLSSTGDTLTIQYPGTYFIYSQITFSKHSNSSLRQAIWRKEASGQEAKVKEILRSYCSLDPHITDLCTASLSGVFQLQKDQQLYVTVTNTSLLNRDSCSFGLFKLQDNKKREIDKMRSSGD